MQVTATRQGGWDQAVSLLRWERWGLWGDRSLSLVLCRCCLVGPRNGMPSLFGEQRKRRGLSELRP